MDQPATRFNPEIDYRKSDKPYVVCRFITECMNKLSAKVTTNATALCLFHKYIAANPDPSYDPYLMACSCIYVAGKEENDHLRIRDLINVALRTLKKINEPLDIEHEYHATREAIVQAELFLLRMINFETHLQHPHKYLLHYLKSLKEWFSPEVWDKYPIAKTSWSILLDFHHDPNVLRFDKSLVSIACVKLALQSYGLTVPYDGPKQWPQVLNKEATEDALWEITAKILEVYTQDLSLIHPLGK